MYNKHIPFSPYTSGTPTALGKVLKSLVSTTLAANEDDVKTSTSFV